jgi:RNA-dependent RNA polymerase
MSEQLRDDVSIYELYYSSSLSLLQIQKKLGKSSFSVVQFRFAGAKGVLSVDPRLGTGHHLCIRPSMNKFISKHRCFEVCKVSAPRSFYLNRQAILLLSNRRISDAIFLILQQRNHLTLIRALLRNKDAKNLLDEKLPHWFLRYGANIDFVHEPFFRQVLITACLVSTGELLKRTRIRVPRNKARNMFGIIDEYNVLEPDQVFIQYTRLNDHEDNEDYDKLKKTEILDNRKVVITKNPCHHPGDVRTFTAVNHEALRHLKDVIVFSQRGDRPASHQISGSDLDGDEYAVIWHEDLVPLQTPNATPYDYDSQGDPPLLKRPVNRNDINDIVLNIAESDYLAQLCTLHLAYADRFGVNSNVPPNNGVLSTIELAGAISEEVDSGKTGQHPLNEIEIKKQSEALGNKRPDFMQKADKESEPSPKILGKIFRLIQGHYINSFVFL